MILRKWDDVSTDELLSYISYLKQNYDPELSRNVIELFHERMRDGVSYDQEALHIFIKHAFARIMGEPEDDEDEDEDKKKKNESADQAFGLKPPPRGKHARPNTVFRDMSAAAIVILQRRRGVTWEEAVTDAAQCLDLGERIIERAYRAMREHLEFMLDETLIELADTELPPP